MKSKVRSILTKAPDGTLIDVVENQPLRLRTSAGEKGTVVAFICNHCPFVNHILSQIVVLARAYSLEGINFLAISPSDISQFPKDDSNHMREVAKEFNFNFPYLYDENQEISKAFGVNCTPDFYVLNVDWKIFYRGQFDESRPANTIPVTGEDLASALNALLNGEDLDRKPTLSVGCLVRWK